LGTSGGRLRPFAVGTDCIRRKRLKKKQLPPVTITGWKLQNKKTGEVKVFANDEYEEPASYPKEEWGVVEQIKTKPAIEATKVSEFSIISPDGFDVAEIS
jgi:hypothetical protein